MPIAMLSSVWYISERISIVYRAKVFVKIFQFDYQFLDLLGKISNRSASSAYLFVMFYWSSSSAYLFVVFYKGTRHGLFKKDAKEDGENSSLLNSVCVSHQCCYFKAIIYISYAFVLFKRKTLPISEIRRKTFMVSIR